MKDERRFTVRMPGPIADWLSRTKDAEGSTVNFEIIRSVRERMQRHGEVAGQEHQGASFAKTAPGGI